jgi:hypothetical protein
LAWHQRGPALVDLALGLVDLVPVEEHLADAPRCVVGPGALGVLRDVHAVQERLAVGDLAEPVAERRATGPQRLHLGADEHQARLEHVVDVVVVPGLAVLRDQLAPDFLGHGVILSAGGRAEHHGPVVSSHFPSTASVGKWVNTTGPWYPDKRPQNQSIGFRG